MIQKPKQFSLSVPCKWNEAVDYVLRKSPNLFHNLQNCLARCLHHINLIYPGHWYWLPGVYYDCMTVLCSAVGLTWCHMTSVICHSDNQSCHTIVITQPPMFQLKSEEFLSVVTTVTCGLCCQYFKYFHVFIRPELSRCVTVDIRQRRQREQ